MRYYIIAGEASGDLHASHLMAALRERDPDAHFRGIGGQAMQAQGLSLLRHFSTLAFMGFVQVLLHLPTILRGMRQVKADILHYRPHALILVDYPGFNLRLARWAQQRGLCPVAYYILPKTWASRPSRNRALLASTQLRLSILPFERDYFAQHSIPVHYVGNPTHHEVQQFLATYVETRQDFLLRHQLDPSRPLIALLPGSRTAEIHANLPRMLAAIRLADPQQHYHLLVAQAPGQHDTLYETYAREAQRPITLLSGQTYPLLLHAHAALVTSGTATLETALLGTPQVVAYYLRGGALVRHLHPLVLRSPYISLVNLILQRPVVPELIGPDACPTTMAQHLAPLLTPEAQPSPQRTAQLAALAQLPELIGDNCAPQRAASLLHSLVLAPTPSAPFGQGQPLPPKPNATSFQENNTSLS